MLIKDMDNDKLRTHYRELRNLAYNNAQMAQGGRPNRRLASQMGRLQDHIQICESVARQRKISLV